MNRYVADTMALVLRLEKRKMPVKIREKFEKAENEQAEIHIPSMVFAEVGYLSEKGTIDTNLSHAFEYVKNYTGILEFAITMSTVMLAFEIDDIPELHDRLIAAVGKELDESLLSNDPVILNSNHVKTIWK